MILKDIVEKKKLWGWAKQHTQNIHTQLASEENREVRVKRERVKERNEWIRRREGETVRLTGECVLEEEWMTDICISFGMWNHWIFQFTFKQDMVYIFIDYLLLEWIFIICFLNDILQNHDLCPVFSMMSLHFFPTINIFLSFRGYIQFHSNSSEIWERKKERKRERVCFERLESHKFIGIFWCGFDLVSQRVCFLV